MTRHKLSASCFAIAFIATAFVAHAGPAPIALWEFDADDNTLGWHPNQHLSNVMVKNGKE